MSDSKLTFIVINHVQNAWICGNNNTGIRIKFCWCSWINCTACRIRKMFFKSLKCLTYKFFSVCQEQNMLNPFITHKDINEGNSKTSFTSSCSHYIQCTASFCWIRITDRSAGHLNKRTVRNICIYTSIFYFVKSAFQD